MRELTVRLDALDPEAGAALRVVTYFDDLLAHGAGIQSIVRGAAMLTAGPVALVDHVRQVHIRVDADGRTGRPAESPDPRWPHISVGSGDAVLWLERSGSPRPIDAIVLERAAAVAATVLDRTRGSGRRRPHDPASIEVLLDAEAAPDTRAMAAQRLGMAAWKRARAAAFADGGARIYGESEDVPSERESSPPSTVRAGIGPLVAVDDLPASWAQARLALRLTAAGTPADPGPRIVHAEEAGGLLVLARTVGPGTPEIEDVAALERAARTAPWILATLEAVSASSSLRGAATRLRLHHSTLQKRITHAERLLGWSLTDAHGGLRLQLALVLRRLHRIPLDPCP
ncbi:helix-turn-helix domain-containing protein [Cryptosporangium aurantiacum]|uniref:PucR C-terminal helix-turn-helix domain-containing protein n=1 Tax=Cryptosporangium aurantiacum TaxID=134849 RepID=A0A1M7R409_9ACTN|nr:helix-turn-helix domain-containing protein [Cryptosporangium aurantiacum]SHN39699.1 PucR C-terminal helix-turn-helix domain-containing protein [Cryptosporangium aurantiacum]